jgi:CMP-N-acetylneuraminic acid synthetase
MKTVAFIPIKLNNERTPGKNIKPFSDGTPLMNFVQEALRNLKQAGIIDDIYVYCSDEAVKPYILQGIEFLKRPKFLDQKETKGTEIYKEFVRTVDADIYVLAHATSPFIKTEHIKDCVKAVQSGEYDSAFCAKKIQNFLWSDNRPMNFTLNDPPRTQDMKPIYMEQSTPYVFTKQAFLKYGARTGLNPYICECDEVECIDIDYPEDFELANAVYCHYIKKL